MAKKPTNTNAKKKTAPAGRVTPAKFRRAMAAVVQQAGGAGMAAAQALKVVTFTCSNAGCLVGITSGPLNLVFSGSGAAMFPVGNSPLFYRVQGPKTPVTVAVTGGTLSSPIAGLPAFGGMTTLTVP